MKTFFLLIALISQTAWANSPQSELMLQTLTTVKTALDVNYSLKDIKVSEGWRLDSEMEQLRELTASGKLSVPDFRRNLAGILRQAQDFHLELGVNSTAYSVLPLQFRSAVRADGTRGIFLVWKDVRDPTLTQAEIGDELVRFNGQPIEKELSQLQNLTGLAARRRAEEWLTVRAGHLGLDVPSGTLTLELKNKNGTSYSVTTRWLSNPEGIGQPGTQPISSPSLLQPQTIWISGAKFGYLPKLGRIVWTAPINDSFPAYVFEDGGRKFAYLRIPTFKVSSSRAVIEELKRTITLLQEQADALLIDISNNPGGDIIFSYAIISLLIDHPVAALNFRRKINYDDVHKALLSKNFLSRVTDDRSAQMFFGADVLGYPVDFSYAETMRSEAETVLATWAKGQTLTPPISSEAVAVIKPNTSVNLKRFIKPIVVWVDEGSRSSADFFAAILKDSGRAHLIGHPTAGAGGRFRDISLPNFLGVQNLRVTDAYAVRANGQLLEGNGVEPSAVYSIAVEDLLSGFIPLKSKILFELHFHATQ